MKIAVSYSGFIRSFSRSFDNHLNTFIQEFDCDIYCHMWDSFGFGRIGEIYDSRKDKISPNEVEHLVSKIKPVQFIYEKYEEFEPKLDDLLKNNIKEFPFCKNVLSMHYKIYKANELIINSNQKYDIVVRIRPDHFFNQKLNFKKIHKNSIYTSLTPARNNGGGINDQFAYGNLESMTKYSNLYNNWNILNNNRKNCNPEHILREHLDYEKINILHDDEVDHWILTEDNTLR